MSMINEQSLRQSMERTKDYTDSAVAEVKGYVDDSIPTSLPVFNFGSGNESRVIWWKFAEVFATRGAAEAMVSLKILDSVANTLPHYGILDLIYRGNMDPPVKLQWEVTNANSTVLDSFVAVYTVNDSNVHVECFFRAATAYDKINMSEIMHGISSFNWTIVRTPERYDALPEGTIISSTVMPLLNPANGGNADYAKRLSVHYVGSFSNTITEPALYKVCEYNMGVSYLTSQTVTLSISNPIVQGFIGLLNISVNGGANAGISKASLEWSLLTDDIDLSNFIIAFTPNGTNPGTITLYFRSSSDVPRIAFSAINDMEIRPSDRLWTLYDGLDVPSENISESYAQQISTTKTIYNNSSEVADLKAYIGYTDSDIYGLEADFENNKFTRLAGAVGKNPGADFDNVNAFGGRRRCAVADDGTIGAYYGEDGYDEDGYLDSLGEQAQCMVEQPKFYYKVVPLKTEKIDGADGYHLRKARYYISDTPKPGFKIHPAFVRNGVEMDKIYLSSYEGGIYDVSAGTNGRLRNDEQVADFNTDKLCSTANVLPATGTTQELTRANVRKLAHNRGEGWEITTIQTLSATQLLFAIEYATFNSQTAIGDGVVGDTTGIKTGSTSSLGNASGTVESGGVSYRGEENLWGNRWKFEDGANILNDTPIGNHGRLFVADHGFADDTGQNPYEDTGIRPCNTNGYVSAFGYSEKFDWLFAPSEVKGSSAVPVGDWLWNDKPGWRITGVGGSYNIFEKGGIFCWSGHGDSTYTRVDNSARLVYFPTPTAAPTSEEVT